MKLIEEIVGVHHRIGALMYVYGPKPLSLSSPEFSDSISQEPAVRKDER